MEATNPSNHTLGSVSYPSSTLERHALGQEGTNPIGFQNHTHGISGATASIPPLPHEPVDGESNDEYAEQESIGPVAEDWNEGHYFGSDMLDLLTKNSDSYCSFSPSPLGGLLPRSGLRPRLAKSGGQPPLLMRVFLVRGCKLRSKHRRSPSFRVSYDVSLSVLRRNWNIASFRSPICRDCRTPECKWSSIPDRISPRGPAAVQ